MQQSTLESALAAIAEAEAAEQHQGPITVTKTFLPPLQEYMKLLEGIWESGWVTNNGPLQQKFEASLEQQFGLAHPLFVVNGTIAINLAIRALDLKGEIITTGFSHPVTTICILWEGCKPVFVDIDPDTFCINPEAIEAKITADTCAILATHVYGIPCDVEAIEAIAKKHGLKVIYDGAHAFGTTYKGKSLLNYGDVSSTSFHATKIFHTVEGGSLHTTSPELYQKLRLVRMMGQHQEQFSMLGLNAKNSEFHAAMGLANMPYAAGIMEARAHQWQRYFGLLGNDPVGLAKVPADTGYNHSYFPVVLRSEEVLLRVRERLNAAQIFPRRYFHPAVTELPYVARVGDCPIAESTSKRVLCLPMYHGLEDASIDRIVRTIREAL